MSIQRPLASQGGNLVQRGTKQLTKAVQSIKNGTARLIMPDRLNLTTAQKLGEGNKRALQQAGASIVETVTHPLDSIVNAAKGVADAVTRPDKALAQVASRFENNPVDGVIAGANLGAAYGGLGAMLLTAGALIAAPFTAGGSLALLPVAATVGSVAGGVGLGAMGASFIKNQADIAGSQTMTELEKESKELGTDYANAGMTAISAGVGKAVETGWQKVKPKNLNPASVERNAIRINEAAKKKLGIEIPATSGGTVVDGLSLDELRQQAIQEVKGAIDNSAQGKRNIEVSNIDRGSFEGLDELGLRRIAYHGTRAEVSPLIQENGFKNSAVGDYGSGIYLGSSAQIGVAYADDVTIGRGNLTQKPAVFTAEIAPGSVMDYLSEKDRFLDWAKTNFDPTDLSDPINQLYANPEVPVSPWIDNTWNRFLPRYAEAKGFDSILVRGLDGPGNDYWVIHDPARVIVRQEIRIDPPPIKELFPSEIAVSETMTALRIASSEPEN